MTNIKKHSYKDIYDNVFASGKYQGRNAKIEQIAQLVFANDRTQSREEAVWQALEHFESMCGDWFDPIQEEFNSFVDSVI